MKSVFLILLFAFPSLALAQNEEKPGEKYLILYQGVEYLQQLLRY